MKNIKKTNFKRLKAVIGLGILSMLFMTACNQDDVQTPASEIDDAAMEAESIAQSDFEEIDDITSNVMVVTEGSTGGRIASVDDDRCQCAEITHDIVNKTITIDFGDGCEGPMGVVRSGIIFITYDGHRFVPDSWRKITFRDYYVNRRHIEGLRTITNISETIESNPTFHITLKEGKVTWPDETFATREADRIRVWIRAENPLFDEFHILGGSVSSGVNRTGIAYNTEVLTDLVYKRNCRNLRRIRIPVQGTKEIVTRENTCVIDFGDGECDTEVELRCGDTVKNVDWSDRM
jgi:hypothetical protein